MTIRQALPPDLDAVLAIERASETAPHWPAAEYLRILRGDGPVRRCFFVAGEGSVAGFAVGTIVAGTGELETVAVAPEARRRGLGTALCKAVIAWCRDAGANAVELEVRAAGAEAIRLYRRLGFEEVGRRLGYYASPPDDAALMRIGLDRFRTEGDV